MSPNTTTTVVVISSFVALLFLYGVNISGVSETLSENKKKESSPTEVALKAAPTDIIYSKVYRDSNGESVVKYAYLADEIVPADEGEDVRRRTPTSQTVVIDTYENEEGEVYEKLKTTFTTSPQFFNDNGQWKQIEYATTTQKEFSMSGAKFHIQKREWVERIAGFLFGIKPVFAQTSTFNPDANTETTSVDGEVLSYCLGCTWATAYSGSNLSANDSGNPLYAYSSLNYTAGRPAIRDFDIVRSFLLFDTSSLPEAASITTATLAIYVTVVADGNGGSNLHLVSSSPTSNTAIATGDWSAVGSTNFATPLAFSGLSTSAYNAFTLNSTGRAAISLTGVSKFSIREDSDFTNTAVGIAATVQDLVGFSSAEQTGTSQDPKLEVTYTAAADFTFGQWFQF